ncbi:MAG: dTMP kinase [Desulfobacterales bacterium]
MFISICGVEGSGKTTQLKYIARFLEGTGKKFLMTREPGGTAIGMKIRRILLDPENRDLTAKAELFLYAADRIQHIEQLILPALREGKIVVTDRFADSTTVYQGYARGIDLELVEKINELVLGGLKPNLTILLDIPPAIGLARVQNQLQFGQRTESESRFEQERLGFHEKIRHGFLTLARNEPDRFQVIDAGQHQDKVSEDILQVLKKALVV